MTEQMQAEFSEFIKTNLTMDGLNNITSELKFMENISLSSVLGVKNAKTLAAIELHRRILGSGCASMPIINDAMMMMLALYYIVKNVL